MVHSTYSMAVEPWVRRRVAARVVDVDSVYGWCECALGLWRYKMAGWGLDHGVSGLGWTTTKHSLS